MNDVAARFIGAPIGEFCVLSGLGRTRVYELINDGSLDSVTIGRRCLVLVDSYRRFIDRQRAAAGSGASSRADAVDRG
jgi:hypothetical protein